MLSSEDSTLSVFTLFSCLHDHNCFLYFLFPQNDPVDLIAVEEIVRSALMGSTTTIDLSPSLMAPQIREVITQSQSGGYTMSQRVPYQAAVSIGGKRNMERGSYYVTM